MRSPVCTFGASGRLWRASAPKGPKPQSSRNAETRVYRCDLDAIVVDELGDEVRLVNVLETAFAELAEIVDA